MIKKDRLPGNSPANKTPLRDWIVDSYGADGRSWPSTSPRMGPGGGVAADGVGGANHTGGSDHDIEGRADYGTPSWKTIDQRRTQGEQPKSWDHFQRHGRR